MAGVTVKVQQEGSCGWVVLYLPCSHVSTLGVMLHYSHMSYILGKRLWELSVLFS